jgi:hypothetical protein
MDSALYQLRVDVFEDKYEKPVQPSNAYDLLYEELYQSIFFT